MGNQAALIRAENAGRPITARGRNFIEFDIGGNQLKRVFTQEPMHVRGVETEIDTAFVPDTGAWQWKLAQADFQVHTRDIFNSGALVEWRHSSGQWIIVDPQSINWVNQDYSRQQIAIKQAVSPTVNDATMRWQNAYGTGRHFEYAAHPQRLTKYFVIDALANLPTPSITGTINFEAEFTLATSTGVELWLDGVMWDKASGVRVQTANRIEFRDTANTQVLWYADAPTAVDATGMNRTSCQYEVTRQGGPSNLFIYVRVPYGWMQTAAYPIKIDPTFTDGYGGDVQTYNDTYLDESTQLVNHSTETTIPVGYYSSGITFRSLLQFNVSSIPSSSICSSATLTLVVASQTQNASSIEDVHRMIRAWSPTEACWARYAGTNNWGSPGANNTTNDRESAVLGSFTTAVNPANGTSCDFSLDPAMVQDWWDGGLTNNGIIVRNRTEGPDNYRVTDYASADHATTGWRPKLVVVYEAVAPLNVSITPDNVFVVGVRIYP